MRQLALIALLAVNPAMAQTAPSTPAAPPAFGNELLSGPAVPGVCLLSRQAVFADTKVGQSADKRIAALMALAQQEIDNERKPVDSDLQAFNAEAGKLLPEQREARRKVLQDRLQPIEAKTRLRAREIALTREKAAARITLDMWPVLGQVYKQHNCGLLIDRGSVFGGNMANDLTAAVVQSLDAKVTAITFERETLPADPAPAR